VPGADFPKLEILKYDKVIHTIFYFIFGVLLFRAFETKNASPGFPWKRLLLMMIAIMIYGASDEYHQHFVPGRTMDVYDWIADSSGGVFALIVVTIDSIRRRSIGEKAA
jgi:VanZ family protein